MSYKGILCIGVSINTNPRVVGRSCCARAREALPCAPARAADLAGLYTRRAAAGGRQSHIAYRSKRLLRGGGMPRPMLNLCRYNDLLHTMRVGSGVPLAVPHANGRCAGRVCVADHPERERCNWLCVG